MEGKNDGEPGTVHVGEQRLTVLMSANNDDPMLLSANLSDPMTMSANDGDTRE
jgi:hypothetical protein